MTCLFRLLSFCFTQTANTSYENSTQNPRAPENSSDTDENTGNATCLLQGPSSLLGGSRVVISGVVSRITIIITHIRGLISPLITTHEPPSGLSSIQGN